MDISIFFIQLLNAVQYGLVLFLVASGLTLIFGIMGIINLAHGSFFMLGAWLAWWLTGIIGSFALAIVIGLVIMVVGGMLLERGIFRGFYVRDHLYQVLLTYGLILVFEELRSIFWGNDVQSVPVPAIFDFSIPLTEQVSYSVYRLFTTIFCVAVAIGLFMLIKHTKLGMTIRAGASNRQMVQSLGINISLLYMLVFALGVGLAAFAGLINSPISSVYPNMGGHVMIMSFVVVVIGGIGSVKGAFIASLLIGLAETFGQLIIPTMAGMTVYILMAAVLIWRPQGLFQQA